ncbi:MAG: type II toxin-antitoxin system RelE/ParE family toxin [Acidobacteriaceae bacterium]
MIRSFKSREAERIYRREHSRQFAAVERVIFRKLRQIDNVSRLEELDSPPGNRLEALRGDRKGQHSIRVNDQWRICFVWRTGDAFEVEIVDCH